MEIATPAARTFSRMPRATGGAGFDLAQPSQDRITGPQAEGWILQQFGRVLFADFKYVQLNTGARVWGDQGGRYRKNGTRGVVKRVQRNQVYPSIQLYIKPGMTADAVLN